MRVWFLALFLSFLGAVGPTPAPRQYEVAISDEFTLDQQYVILLAEGAWQDALGPGDGLHFANVPWTGSCPYPIAPHARAVCIEPARALERRTWQKRWIAATHVGEHVAYVYIDLTGNKPDASELKGIAAHELGHAMGVNHVPDENALMYYAPWRRTPTRVDVEAWRHVPRMAVEPLPSLP